MIDFEQQYQDHYADVYRICLARFKNEEFVKEVVQEAFYRAYTHLMDLRDDAKFLPWVVTTALRYGYNMSRQDLLRHNQLPEADYAGQAAHMDVPGYRHDEVNAVRRWILAQSDADQGLFLMKHFYSMSDADIGRVTNKSPGSVKARLLRLKAKLQEAMQSGSA